MIVLVQTVKKDTHRIFVRTRFETNMLPFALTARFNLCFNTCCKEYRNTSFYSTQNFRFSVINSLLFPETHSLLGYCSDNKRNCIIGSKLHK